MTFIPQMDFSQADLLWVAFYVGCVIHAVLIAAGTYYAANTHVKSLTGTPITQQEINKAFIQATPLEEIHIRGIHMAHAWLEQAKLEGNPLIIASYTRLLDGAIEQYEKKFPKKAA